MFDYEKQFKNVLQTSSVGRLFTHAFSALYCGLQMLTLLHKCLSKPMKILPKYNAIRICHIKPSSSVLTFTVALYLRKKK